ncbi:putative F-box protein [Platanthera guangdongensis]|uniref:F-box protein n=1 Tax=Platanthera guangdongensis TaxID=2320717 RepID=A0ABR2MDD4_9ASPA
MDSSFDLHLPEDLTREILLRLPAKSVAMFRCVSTVWLSISTDPSFILSHARRAPKFLLVRSACADKYIKLPASGLSTTVGINKRGVVRISDEAMSSCDGLVCFRGITERFALKTYYAHNPLSNLQIRMPTPGSMYTLKNSVCELYWNRRRGEYQLLNISQHCRPNYHLRAVVLGSHYSSWEIYRVPFVTDLKKQSCVLVNDCLYWTCRRSYPKSIGILVFDTLKESFSLMQLPSNGRKVSASFENYGLVEMEGELGYWTAELCKSRSVRVEIWTQMSSDEKWRNTHSLCLAGDAMSLFCFPKFLFACFEGGFVCLFKDEGLYLLHWDLKSGKYYIEKLPMTDIAVLPPARIHRETLVNPPSYLSY